MATIRSTSGRSEALVLQKLREQGSSSIAELARLSGLGKATVSRIVAGLRERKVIEETGEAFRSSEAGRAGRALRIRPDAGLYLGLAFGPGFVHGVLADAAKQIRDYRQIDHAMDGELSTSLDALDLLIAGILEDNGTTPSRLLGIGVAVGAPVDPRNGTVGSSALVPETKGVRVGRLLSERLGVRVLCDNESNCSALAEILWGGMPQTGTHAYIKFDYGLGGAIVQDGRIHQGRRGFSGEFGHIPYDRNGAYCRCGGRGCFEQYLSIPGILKRAETISGPLSFTELRERLNHGDHAVEQVVAEAGTIAGDLLALLMNVVDPDSFVIGGNLSLLGDMFIRPMSTRYKALTGDDAPIAIGSAGNVISGLEQQDEPALGAIGLVLKQLS